MNEPRRLLALVVEALDRMGAAHALVGAAALAARGVARSTFDTDLLTTNAAVLDRARWAGFSRMAGCAVDVRRGDGDDPLAGVVRLTREGEPDLDVVVGRAAWQAEAIARADLIDLDDVRVRVVTAADLVLLKLFAGGTQDLWDVEQLLATDPAAIRVEVDSRIDLLPARAQRAWDRLKADTT